jgi:hypothetical protein
LPAVAAVEIIRTGLEIGVKSGVVLHVIRDAEYTLGGGIVDGEAFN